MKTRILKISILVIILLITIAFIASPYVARNYILKHGKEWIGRDISLNKIHINFFTSTVRLIDFKMYEHADSSIFTSFDTLLIDIEPLQLLRNKVVVEQFYLKGLTVSVIQKDSSFNFDDLIAYHSNNKNTTQTSNGNIYEFEISNIELKNGNATFTDASVGKEVKTNSIDLVIPYIAWNEKEMSKGGIKFSFDRGGYFESNFNLQPVTGAYTASLTINKLYLDPFYDFSTRYLRIGSINGYVNGNLNVVGNINDADKSTASGFVSLMDFEITNNEKKKLVGVKELDVVMHKADFFNSQYVFDSVRIDQSYVLLEMRDSTFNFSNVVIQVDTTSQGNQTTIASDSVRSNNTLYYSLNSFMVSDGKIEFVDHRADEPFVYNLSKVEMQVDSISSDAEYLVMSASMLLNERGTLKAELVLNPKNPLDLTLDYVITDFQLSDLNIYSRHYMGFPIFYGDMYYKANTTIDNGQLTSENNLIIQNVELGNKRGGLYDLPIKFALFLLKDKDGVIKLDVPVRGDLKDPKIKVGRIIWNTFKNLIVKTVAAPGKFLSNIINVDPKDIEAIEFNYNDTTLTENQRHQIDLLLELEQKKQGLEIEMIYFNDRQLEKEEIAVILVKDEYKKSGGNINSESDFEKYVKTRLLQDSLPVRTACFKIADKSRVDSIATGFERDRIRNLKQLLKSKSDSTRISLSVGTLKSPKNVARKPAFEVKFSLGDSLLSRPTNVKRDTVTQH